jgi:transposase
VKRYAESGLEGLKNLPRTGRPPQVSGQKFAEIKRELSENLAGWRAKEVMNIIYEKTGVRYHEVHIYRLLHKWGFSPKVPRKRFVNTASNKEKKQFKKRPRK